MAPNKARKPNVKAKTPIRTKNNTRTNIKVAPVKAPKTPTSASVTIEKPFDPKGRPPWKIYFMKVAQLIATRSTCLRRQVGAVIVRENRILATGYNGAPSCLRHCHEYPGGCLRETYKIPSGQRQELCRGLHAEQNAILQAAAFGVSLRGSEVYCTHQPCITCAKMLINSGIEKVYFLGDYPDSLALEMMKEGNISLERIQV